MWHGCFFMSFFKSILPYNNITQRMCDEAVDDSLAALKLIPDWFATSKTIKGFKLLCMQEMFTLFPWRYGDVTLCCGKIPISSIK